MQDRFWTKWNNLTVEKILAGNSNIRNPILVSYVAKGLLPYHGLGSGIAHALDAWPKIDFVDDRDGCLFTATVHRKPVDELTLTASSPKTEDRILELIRQDPYVTTETMGEILGIRKRNKITMTLVKAARLVLDFDRW